MTLRTRRWLTVYLVLLLALSVLGASNQGLYAEREDLLHRKDALRLELSELRREAASISGALAVRQWAYAEGMVSATELESLLVAPVSAPSVHLAEGGLEVKTLWR